MSVYLCVGFIHVNVGVHRIQRRASEPLGLELWAVVRCPTWVLRAELRFSARTSALNLSSLPLLQLGF